MKRWLKYVLILLCILIVVLIIIFRVVPIYISESNQQYGAADCRDSNYEDEFSKYILCRNIARTQNDPSICDYIENISYREDCLAQFD